MISRRGLIALSAFAGAGALTATPSQAQAVAAQEFVSATAHSGALNTWATKSITPSNLPSSGASWDQRLNSRVDGNSYYSLVLFSSGTAHIGLRLEKVTDGSGKILSTKKVSANLAGQALEMRLLTRLPYLYGEVYQGGKKLTSVEFTEKAQPLMGEEVTSSAYVNGNRGISFQEKISVTPYDTRPGNTYAGSHWKLAFNDEFTGNAIDTKKWNILDSAPALAYTDENTANSKGAWSNSPGKTPTINAAECISVAHGKATFRVKKLAKNRVVDGAQRKYLGGYLDTGNPIINNRTHQRNLSAPAKFSAEYMRVEIRAKMPSGRKTGGNHACLWLRPDSKYLSGSSQSTPSIEIDINEYYGYNYKKKANNFDTTERTESTVHFDQTGKNKTSQVGNKPTYGIRWTPAGDQKLQDEFHVWTLEITPNNGIKVIYDHETEILHVPANDPRLLKAKKPGVKLHLRLNFEGGSNYWGEIAPDNNLAGTMVVDYVRAWTYVP